MVQLLQALDKTPVRVCYDIPGFIGNRLQHAMWREAIAMVASGVCDATTLDLVVRGTIGLRLAAMGPIENADYVGLDMTAAIHEAILPSLDCSTSPNPLLRELISQGRSGAKVGHGFLEWPVGTREDAARRLDEHLRTQLANHRHLTSEIS
jgi:3-hydroxybutyryl-CoA dehydrogenase